MYHRALKHRLFVFAALGALVLTAATLSGCSHSKPVTLTVPPVVQPFNGHVTIYTIATSSQQQIADDNGLVAETILVDPNAKDPAREALDALIADPNSPLPHGTKLLDIAIDQSTGLATLNFSSEFKDNFSGGDTREAQVLNSVRETLGQFSTVENVQFLIAGKKIDSLGGTEDLSDPLPVIKDTKEAAIAG